MASIFVLGAASLDTLHIQNQTHSAAGGAGLYTALAAIRAGSEATLFAPKPDPVPERLQPIEKQLHWTGPAIEQSQLPRLEIAHHGNGKATLMDASWGALLQESVDQLPDVLSSYAFVHIAALPTAQRQLAALRACRQRGAAAISVGTYAKVVAEDSSTVRLLLDESDLFFMNENEATMLFGSLEQIEVPKGKLVFITRDKDGAWICSADSRVEISGTPVAEIDPTGAGDTFCGATLAGIAQGLDKQRAAQNACNIAARTVQNIGPAGLLSIR